MKNQRIKNSYAHSENGLLLLSGDLKKEAAKPVAFLN